jgi:transcriptional regulator with XRE-family HTH domain
MNEINYKNWYSMSDNALMLKIGAFIKHHRLSQNKTQDSLSHDAGISRSTLSLLEKGETVTVSTLIQVLRVLNQLEVMNAFEIPDLLSPLALAKVEEEQRQRARSTKPKKQKGSSW